ncbi:MAG: hypothetical protein H6983_18035 [Ectothiorhodospiraceae bacterium]|nr:hypothetical protein [Ectothiorhodospiraceae bacterium]
MPTALTLICVPDHRAWHDMLLLLPTTHHSLQLVLRRGPRRMDVPTFVSRSSLSAVEWGRAEYAIA